MSPPRLVEHTTKVWTSRGLSGLRLTCEDTENGVLVRVGKGTMNSIFISRLMDFLSKAHTSAVPVTVETADDLTYRSLKCIGVPKLATLVLDPAKYPHGVDGGTVAGDQGSSGATQAPDKIR